SDIHYYDIVGCIEISQNAIRGREVDGLHVLGLVDELEYIIKEYLIDVVIIVGSAVPFSKVLNQSGRIGSMRPEFKLVPELKSVKNTIENKTVDINLIDIRP
ncbi:nucleoside-diphosphate sugar epimerase/dehydratase, partial [Candidatus Latescibacterota bacterium]